MLPRWLQRLSERPRLSGTRPSALIIALVVFYAWLAAALSARFLSGGLQGEFLRPLVPAFRCCSTLGCLFLVPIKLVSCGRCVKASH